jgi:outer membrane protein OmpA-like peptidoglycan-associated protein
MLRSLSTLALLVVCCLGTVLSAQAAPPRFTDWGQWRKHDTSENAASANQLAAAGTAVPEEKFGPPDPAPNVEQVQAGVVPAALIHPGASNTDTDPAPASSASTTAESAPEKNKRSFWSWFKKREPIVPKEKTRKPVSALVNTTDHHADEVELLGIGETRFFGPHLENARWQVTGSRVQCSLQQTLPQYGFVAFREGSQQPLRFELHVDRPPAGLARARIRSVPPPWKHLAEPKDLGVLALTSDEKALSADRQWARRLMAELAEGMQPTLSYWGAVDGGDDIEVQISAMHFAQGLSAFQACLDQLVELDVTAFEKEKTVVHFGFDSAKLDAPARQTLDKLALVLNSDKHITRVLIEGHTDSRGFRRYNAKLATRRAKAVRQYLVGKGVAGEKLHLKLRSFGETKPDASNRTAQGRHENRRVEITLHRGQDKS